MRRRYFGGNSGYIGYSMSVNAMEAKNNGRYPKTQFKKVYSINDEKLSIFVNLDIISDKEWHHTSKYGNKTTFYSWIEEKYLDCYRLNKSLINNLIKAKHFDEIKTLFEDFVPLFL